MPTMKTTQMESPGAKQTGFDAKSGEHIVEGAPQPMDKSAIGEPVMNAAQAAMPKVAGYPY